MKTLAFAAALVATSAAQAQGAQGRPDAAGHRHLCRAGHRHRERLQALRREQGGKLGGREIEFVKVDDESDPAKATDNVNKLIKRDNVDVLVGTVHSASRWRWPRSPRDTGTLLIVPNAGADAVTGPMCGANIFRSSFSNWQPGYAMGEVAARRDTRTSSPSPGSTPPGDEIGGGFEAFEKGGGKVVKDLTLPFPNVEFQALLTEIAAHQA